MKLQAAARLRGSAYVFPSQTDFKENLLDLMTVLNIHHSSPVVVDFETMKGIPAVIANIGLDALKAKLLHTVDKAKDETFTKPVSEERQEIHCVCGKFEVEFPAEAGRISGLMAILMAPKEGGHTLVGVTDWGTFLKFKRFG